MVGGSEGSTKVNTRVASAWAALWFGVTACGSEASGDGIRIDVLEEALEAAELEEAELEEGGETAESEAVAGSGELTDFRNDYGLMRTYSTTGSIDLANPFFSVIGTNGRACSTCHLPQDAWGLTPKSAKRAFKASDGLDPLFTLNDGSVSPLADVSTLAKRKKAYALLVDRAVIRIGLPIPANAEFELAAVDDPYGYASAAELSLFRRVLPASNLRFLPAVMWDGRETFAGNTTPQNLAHQANGATLGHAQSTRDLTAEEQTQIVDFEMALVAAQIKDSAAKQLNVDGAEGGPDLLVTQTFYKGINDTFGGDPQGHPFDPNVFTIFDDWATYCTNPNNAKKLARCSIYRGQVLFNTKQFLITGVRGLNDDFNVPEFNGTCTSCHNAPNVGGRSQPPPSDIGVSDAARRVPELPLYTLRNTASGETIQTTDPGRALVSGRWKDINRFKAPGLRALAARAPYFHDGSAATIEDVVDFYVDRFDIYLTDQERTDMVAFLGAL